MSFAKPKPPEFSSFDVNEAIRGVLLLIQQVFLNIALNSIQAMPYGGKLRVQSREVKVNGSSKVEIEIEDTGEGIPEAVKSKVFERDRTGACNSEKNC